MEQLFYKCSVLYISILKLYYLVVQHGAPLVKKKQCSDSKLLQLTNSQGLEMPTLIVTVNKLCGLY